MRNQKQFAFIEARGPSPCAAQTPPEACRNLHSPTHMQGTIPSQLSMCCVPQVNDGSCLTGIQVVVNADTPSFEQARRSPFPSLNTPVSLALVQKGGAASLSRLRRQRNLRRSKKRMGAGGGKEPCFSFCSERGVVLRLTLRER